MKNNQCPLFRGNNNQNPNAYQNIIYTQCYFSLEYETTLNKGNQDEIAKQLKDLTLLNDVHKRKATIFYERKCLAKKNARQRSDLACICMDYTQNLPCLNIATNDSNYRRILRVLCTILSNNEVAFYTYNETRGKKGADDVISMLYHFSSVTLLPEVRHLEIFCDSCAGQNENYTVVRFLHYLVPNMCH